MLPFDDGVAEHTDDFVAIGSQRHAMLWWVRPNFSMWCWTRVYTARASLGPIACLCIFFLKSMLTTNGEGRRDVLHMLYKGWQQTTDPTISCAVAEKSPCNCSLARP